MSESSKSSPNWDAIELLYSEGASDVEIAAFLKITMRKFNRMVEDHQGFADFVEMGNTISQAFWFGQYRKNLGNKNFNSNLLNFYMKNAYNWADRTDTTDLTDKSDKDIEQLKKELQATMKVIAKDNPELVETKQLKLVGKDSE